MFKTPILTVDAIILTLIDGKLKVALMKRPEGPFEGCLALPVGYVHADPQAGYVDSSADAAMRRILLQKLNFKPSHLEQVYTETGPTRDPRGWSASVVHLALHHHEALQPMLDAQKVVLMEVVPTLSTTGLAFDHQHLIEAAVSRLRAKATYSTIVAHLLPTVFRMSDLQAAYELVTGTPTNKDNFRRKILDEGVLVDADLIRQSGGRPARGYRLREQISLLARPIS